MKRMIIGYSGAGKSTLARQLGEHDGVPVLHLDRVRFAPNWAIRSNEEEQEMVRAFLDDNNGWIVDGNYRSMLIERRLQESDQIILLLLNRASCLHRALRRARRFRGQTRPDMGDGCIEKFDWEFARWILRDGRTRERREWYRGIAEAYSDKAVILRSQKQIDRFLQEI